MREYMGHAKTRPPLLSNHDNGIYQYFELWVRRVDWSAVLKILHLHQLRVKIFDISNYNFNIEDSPYQRCQRISQQPQQKGDSLT